MLPFLIESRISPVRLFELGDGRFQILENAEIGPFLPGHGYLLVERKLSDYLVAHEVEGIVCEHAVLFDNVTSQEIRTHVRIRVRHYFTAGQIRELDLAGPRLLTMNDEYYFASPELKMLLEQGSFNYLSFSPGLEDFAGVGG